MSRLKVNITMSLDGFTAGPDQSEREPLGVVSVVPIFLGGGTRLFDNLGKPGPRLRQVQAVDAPGVTHIRYVRVQ